MKKLIVLLTCLGLVTPALADELRLCCIIQPHTVQHLNRCDETPGSYRGCNQLLSLCDTSHGGKTFWSPDHHAQDVIPFRGRNDLCDVFTSRAAQRVVKVKFDTPDPASGATQWICVEGRLESQWELTCLDVDDPMAVPPDVRASADWLGQWHCDRTEPFETYEGAYFRPDGMWSMAWSPEMDFQYACSYPFWQDPGYVMAYQRIVEALTDLGGPLSNPYDCFWEPFEHMRYGLANFSSVLLIVGTGEPTSFRDVGEAMGWYGACPTLSSPWYAMDQAVLWYRVTYVGDGEMPDGWPIEGSYALNELHTHILDGMSRYDPMRIFCWTDVQTQPTTWGQIKALYQGDAR